MGGILAARGPRLAAHRVSRPSPTRLIDGDRVELTPRRLTPTKQVCYDTATEAERVYMAAMADLGPGGHGSSEIAARMGLTVKGASVRRDGLLKKGLIYSAIDTQLDFTVPQFAAFIQRIHPFDAAQRPRRGRPPRKS